MIEMGAMSLGSLGFWMSSAGGSVAKWLSYLSVVNMLEDAPETGAAPRLNDLAHRGRRRHPRAYAHTYARGLPRSYIDHQTHSLESMMPLRFASTLVQACADQYSSAVRNPSPLESNVDQ